jgi:hypothetical protein
MEHRRPRLRRVLLPILVAGAGVYLLIGCIPLPGNFKPTRGERPETRIGKADSDRPIRIGRTTRQGVREVLGLPAAATPDQRVVAYSYSVNTMTILWPLCFRAEPVRGSRYLVLRFDEADLLESFNVYKQLNEIPEYDQFR